MSSNGASIHLPPMTRAKFSLPSRPPIDIAQTVKDEFARSNLAEQVRGKRIAVGLGSRGVAEIVTIARELISHIKAAGGEPFVVPAMGSHGGATAEGQVEVLSGLGVTPETVGCPINATMETLEIGSTPGGFTVFTDKNAVEADGIIVVNRVKIHTDFHGPHESGLMKMMAIGLGKEKGASRIHRFGVQGLREILPQVAHVTLAKTNIIGGLAIVEDGYHRPVHIEFLPNATLPQREQELLEFSRELFPRLPVEDIDVLVIDQMGKDISGAGIDPNVCGRWRIAGEPEPETPRVGAVVVLDLTDASHGNATGIGLAEFTTRRLLDKIDFAKLTKNIYTSSFLMRGNVPLVYETDAAAIQAAIMHVLRKTPERLSDVRLVRIQDTLTMDEMWLTPNLLEEVRLRDDFIEASSLQTMPMQSGQLLGIAE